MKLSIKDFLRISLLKKSLMVENFIFCAVIVEWDVLLRILASARYHSSLQLFKFDRTEKFKIQ